MKQRKRKTGVVVVGRPRKFGSVEELQVVVDNYFAECATMPTVTGLAVALGMTRQGLSEYEARPEFSDAIKRAKTRIEEMVERGMLTGELNVTACIFWLKNHGWRDRHQLDMTGERAGVENATVAAMRLSTDELMIIAASGRAPRAIAENEESRERKRKQGLHEGIVSQQGG